MPENPIMIGNQRKRWLLNIESKLLVEFGFPSNLSKSEGRKFFRKASIKFHPDKKGGNKEKFQELCLLFDQFCELKGWKSEAREERNNLADFFSKFFAYVKSFSIFRRTLNLCSYYISNVYVSEKLPEDRSRTGLVTEILSYDPVEGEPNINSNLESEYISILGSCYICYDVTVDRQNAISDIQVTRKSTGAIEISQAREGLRKIQDLRILRGLSLHPEFLEEFGKRGEKISNNINSAYGRQSLHLISIYEHPLHRIIELEGEYMEETN